MNLPKLFEMQKKLDERIIEKRGLQGQDLLPNTILALYAELGELLNEWRGFKHWSENQEPRTSVLEQCVACKGTGHVRFENGMCDYRNFCSKCQGTRVVLKNPLLEEYVDCLHFFLSIGNQLNINEYQEFIIPSENDLSQCFTSVYHYISILWLRYHDDDALTPVAWIFAFQEIIRLGQLLGFSWGEIEQAYFDKNQVNHDRQKNGY